MPANTIKTSVGAPVPKGWKIVRTTRSAQYIQKVEEQRAPPSKQELDDLVTAFANFGITAEVAPEEELADLMSGMSLGEKKKVEDWGGEEGGRRHKKTRKGGRKSRKNRRTTRKH